MERIIDELAVDQIANARFLMSFVFGNKFPYYINRGEGKEREDRKDDVTMMQSK